MRYLTVKEAAAINQYVITRFSPGEQIGIKDLSLLESAVHRPQQSLLEEDAYPTIEEKAASLFQSLAQNHPFHNANKRTAFLAMIQFLSYNHYQFKMPTQKEQEDFTVDVVNHKYSFEEISAIIGKHMYSML